MSKETSEYKISFLEDVIVNLCTPYDALTVCRNMKREYRGGFLVEFSRLRNYKMEHYQRMVHHKETKGFVPEEVLEPFRRSSFCGKLQTYAIKFRF